MLKCTLSKIAPAHSVDRSIFVYVLRARTKKKKV